MSGYHKTNGKYKLRNNRLNNNLFPLYPVSNE